MNQLASTAKNQIVSHDFSIGAVTWNNNSISTQVSNENSNKWNGKIGFITLSEYLRTNSNKSSCHIMNSYNNNVINCKPSTWISLSGYNYLWTLSPVSETSDYVYRISSTGDIDRYGNVNHLAGNVFTTLYLSSSVQITGGNGSQSNPYTIK